MKRVLVVGGGMSGLVAAWRLGLNAHVKVLEPRKVGGSFMDGGLKYIHRTDAMESMLDSLGVIHSSYIVHGGILMRGKVEPYPRWLQGLPRNDADRVQMDHYRKTRRTSVDDINLIRKSMNDPAATGSRRALKCDFQELIQELARNVDVISRGVLKIDARRHTLHLDNNERMLFDYLVLTLPLWAIQRLADFQVPDCHAMALNIAQVTPRVDRDFAGFDFVYTPYTPADVIHRLSPSEGGYSCENNGQHDQDALISDLNFIFPDGYVLESVKTGLKGHLIPLTSPVEWPDCVAPLGRFAKWDSRATTDVTLQDAIDLAEKWGI